MKNDAKKANEDAKRTSGYDINDFLVDVDVEAKLDRDQAELEVGRPGRQEFFRAHPEFSVLVNVLSVIDGINKTDYLLMSSATEFIDPSEYATRELRLLCTNFGKLYLYPLGVVGRDGTPNKWTVSARHAVGVSETQWVRMASNRGEGQYYARAATDQTLMKDPIWPSDIGPMTVMVRGFGEENIIKDVEHFALRKLRGEAL